MKFDDREFQEAKEKVLESGPGEGTKLVFMWVKQDKITVDQMEHLMELIFTEKFC